MLLVRYIVPLSWRGAHLRMRINKLDIDARDCGNEARNSVD